MNCITTIIVLEVLLLKVDLGSKNCLYPLPVTLIGSIINGKPNYIAIAHVGIMDLGSVSLGMSKIHYTNQGIKENKTFSVNIPSIELVEKTDYCGLVSGKEVNKAEIFKTFYGDLKTAPMIDECPINMECELIKTVDFPNHDIFIGKIVKTFCDKQVLTEGVLDLSKVQPFLFSMSDRSYWKLGEKIGKAWNIGKKLM
jgi:flavin reductase (DIM6/NTAB) family NADH-FMN oxidoreductase RutF